VSDPERMSAQERCRIMADSRCQHPDGPASKAVCDRCWAAEIEAAERAAKAEGYEQGQREAVEIADKYAKQSREDQESPYMVLVAEIIAAELRALPIKPVKEGDGE